MLVFNHSYGKEFSKFISGKYYVIGSFKNNLIKRNIIKKRNFIFYHLNLLSIALEL